MSGNTGDGEGGTQITMSYECVCVFLSCRPPDSECFVVPLSVAQG